MTGQATRRYRTVQGSGTGREAGGITIFVLFLAIAIITVTGLVLDAGGALTDRQRAADLAGQAARAGADVLLPTGTGATPRVDPTAATRAADRFLAAQGLTGTVRATPTAVTVTVTLHHRTSLLSVTGITSLTITGTATATPLPGLQTVSAGG